MSSLVLGTAGHIDHGKSALVKALTGTDPDRLKEEQARGITIDLGFAHASIAGLDVAFVDVPGHERFIRNMLAGAGGLDAVLLVIAADESVMPQTREHFHICRLLGLERGVIVLTKADLADADQLELAAFDARELTAGSFLAAAPVIAVSARTGAGLDTLRAAIAAIGRAPARAGRHDAARMPVDRVFTVRGFGTVVTGTLIAGRVVAGEELVVLPDERRVRVRGVQVHGHAVAAADAPRRVALNLGAVEVGEIARGVTLAAPGSLPSTRRVDVRLDLLAGAPPLRHGARVRVHQGTADLTARVVISAVRPVAGTPWRQAQIGDRAVAVPPGGAAYARLRLDAPMVAARHDRIVLRALSPPETIAGAVVLDPLPPPIGLRRAGVLARFERLDPGAAEAPHDAAGRAAATWLSEAAERGMSADELAARGGMDAADAARTLAAADGSGRAVTLAGRVFDAAVLRRIEEEIVEAVTAHHRADPLAPGIAREAARERAASSAAPGVFDAILARLTAAGTIAGADRLTLATHRIVTTPAEVRASDGVEAAMRGAGLTPPDLMALGEVTGLSPAEVQRAVQLLVREHRLARLGDLTFHVEALAEFKADVRRMGAGRSSAEPPIRLDIATVKQRYGLSRKFAIPLLEWLDRERVTRRVGDSRIVL
jgi:selenocysteine-specific elongation factor